jgi:hypothetical protein
VGSFSGLDKLIESQRRAIEQVLAAGQQGLLQFITPHEGQLQRLTDSIQESVFRAIAAIAESDRWQADHRKYAAVMLALGWPPVMDLYVDQTNEIVSRFDPNDPTALADEVSEALVEFFDEESLGRKLQEWREVKWVDRRMCILEKVILAHVRGDYELSVPAMLPQIEGVVASGFAYTGRLSGRDLDRLYDRLWQPVTM